MLLQYRGRYLTRAEFGEWEAGGRQGSGSYVSHPKYLSVPSVGRGSRPGRIMGTARMTGPALTLTPPACVETCLIGIARLTCPTLDTLARSFNNHSNDKRRCNLQAKGWAGKVIVLVAMRDIAAGEECLYDYGDRRPEVLQNFPRMRRRKKGAAIKQEPLAF